MTRGTLLRIIQAALLAVLLLTPVAAFAQGRASASATESDGGALASVWSFLVALLPGGEALDTRCGIDPNGGISCRETGAALDNRCGIDPNGGDSCVSGL
jgi:hypothetical protein